MARQEAGHLLYGLHCLPSAWLPHTAGQPPGKRPVAALALAQRRSSASGADLQRHLALTLMWPEQIAVSVLSEAEVSACARSSQACQEAARQCCLMPCALRPPSRGLGHAGHLSLVRRFW